MKTFLIEVFMVSTYFTCVKDGFLEIYIVDNTTKRWIRKRVFQKNKARQNFRKTNIFYPDTHRYVSVSKGKICSLFVKFGVLCFLETSVLGFTLLIYYWRYKPIRDSIDLDWINKRRYLTPIFKNQLIHSFLKLLYPLKKQEVEKGCIGNSWVKEVSGSFNKYYIKRSIMGKTTNLFKKMFIFSIFS